MLRPALLLLLCLALPAFALDGVVVDEQGEPIEGASITVVRRRAYGVRQHVAEGASGTQGRVRVPLQLTEGELLQVRKKGFSGRELTPDEFRAAEHLVVLRRGGTLTVRLRDALDRPLEQPGIDFYRHGREGLPYRYESLVFARGTDGGLLPGTYFVHASARIAGIFRSTHALVTMRDGEDTDAEIVFPPGAVLSGRVVAPEGTPLSGVRIETEADILEALHTERMLLVPNSDPRGATDEDGWFVFSDIDEGRYLLTFKKEGWTRGFWNADTAAPETRKITLYPTGTNDTEMLVRGRVLREDGLPLSGVEVSSSGRATTTSDGSYELHLSADTTHRIEWRAPGFAPLVREIDVGHTPMMLDVTLTTGRTIRGRVVDGATHAPIAGAEVSWDDASVPVSREGVLTVSCCGEGVREERPAGLEETRTGRDGTFEFRHVGRDAIRLGIVGKDFAPQVLVVPPERTVVEAALRRGVTIEGRVLTASGAPRPKAEVVAVDAHDLDHVASCDDAGVFRLRGLPRERYELRVMNSANESLRVIEPTRDGVYRVDLRARARGARVTVETYLRGAPFDAEPYLIPANAFVLGTSRSADQLPEGTLRGISGGTIGIAWLDRRDFVDVPPGRYVVYAQRDGEVVEAPVEVSAEPYQVIEVRVPDNLKLPREMD